MRLVAFRETEYKNWQNYNVFSYWLVRTFILVNKLHTIFSGNVHMLTANGPAIWGGCVTRRKHRAGSWYFSQKAVTVQGGYGACFCRHGTNFIEHYACRGTSLIGAANLSPVTKLVGGHWRSVAVQS